MTSNWDSRRVAPRHSLVTLAWYKRIDDAAAESEEGVARSFDVSSGGAGLVATQEIQVGARLLLQLVIPNGKLTAVAHVRNVTATGNGTYRLGLQVYCVPPTDVGIWKRMGGT
jgi:hypothetical protein